MDDQEKAVTNEVEETTKQESPTVEENQPTVETEDEQNSKSTKGDAAETSADRNWRALREENARLKAEKESWLKAQQAGNEEVATPVSQRPDLNMLMSPDDKVELRILEARAEAEFGDAIESDPILRRAVEGEYIAALSHYNQAIMEGKKVALPNPYKIAKHVKGQFDERFGAVSKKAEAEGAKKAQQAKANKEATVEAEGRSDRGRNAQSADDLRALQLKTRQGDSNALAERLSRLGQ